MSLMEAGARPGAPERILRRRALARLAGPERLGIVSAPAGYGKSTLLQQYGDADPRSQAVLRLTPELDDPAALSEALIAALEELGPTAPHTRSVATGVEPTFSAALLPALTALAGSRPQPYLLMLDDLHLLQSDAGHQVVAAVAAGVPAGSRLLLASRHRPPAWLARERASGSVVDIDALDLAFTADEAAGLLAQLGLPGAQEQAGDLVERTEGWAAGLYLSGLALRRSAATSAPRSGSDGFLGDYLRAEVLGPLPPADRELLVATSILDLLEPEVCDEIVGSAGSASTFARIAGDLQFVTATGDGFRCHHLLQAELRDELARRPASEIADYHRRAARRFAVTGRLDEAVRHAVDAGDTGAAAEYIWSGILGCVGSGWPDRLHRWLAGLETHQIEADPWLSLAAGWWGLQSGSPEVMERWALASQRHAGRDWQQRVRTDEYCANLAVLMLVIGRLQLKEGQELGRAAVEGLPADSGFRSAAAFICGVFHALDRDLAGAADCLVEAERFARALGVPVVVADALSFQGLLALTAGDTTTGLQRIGAATEVIRENRLEQLVSSAHCITAQALLAAMTQDRQAAHLLATARGLTVRAGAIAPWFHVAGPVLQARAALLLGDGALARQLVSEARSNLRPQLADTLVSDLLAETEKALAHLSAAGVTGAHLTAAELRVLQFLPGHLSFRQIGEHLFLSQNTIKTHAISIYRKFGVGSRDEAVTRAQDLGLLERAPQD